MTTSECLEVTVSLPVWLAAQKRSVQTEEEENGAAGSNSESVNSDQSINEPQNFNDEIEPALHFRKVKLELDLVKLVTLQLVHTSNYLNQFPSRAKQQSLKINTSVNFEMSSADYVISTGATERRESWELEIRIRWNLEMKN